MMTRLAGRAPVLMYHGVGRVATDPLGLFVTPKRFGRQMATLHRLGLRGVSMGELGDAITNGRSAGLVGVTFDDGYRDVLHFAIPALRRYGFTATVFAVSGMLGGANLWDPPPRRDLMTADDILELAVEGHEIGSHGVSHVRLAGLAPDRLDREVRNSRNQIARVVGSEPRSFCYPYGSVDDKAVRAVGRAGYSYACAVVRVPGLPTQLAMPRVGLDERDRGPRLVAKLFLRGR